MSDDRKYRQRGYQDSSSDRRPAERSRPAPAPYDPRLPRDPKTPNMPGFREVFKCNRCGKSQPNDVGLEARCASCGSPLHSCANCDAFDPGARFECREPVTARVSPKDEGNACSLFSPRIQVQRETGSTPAAGASSARRAFDDLFKF